MINTVIGISIGMVATIILLFILASATPTNIPADHHEETMDVYYPSKSNHRSVIFIPGSAWDGRERGYTGYQLKSGYDYVNELELPGQGRRRRSGCCGCRR